MDETGSDEKKPRLTRVPWSFIAVVCFAASIIVFVAGAVRGSGLFLSTGVALLLVSTYALSRR